LPIAPFPYVTSPDIWCPNPQRGRRGELGVRSDAPARAAGGGGLAGVAELADAPDLGSGDASRGGSRPSARTTSLGFAADQVIGGLLGHPGAMEAAAGAIETRRCRSRKPAPRA